LVFSDSIVLTTEKDGKEDFEHLLERCSALLSVMLANGIALRGAIAYGSYVAQKSDYGTFVAGKAIIEAYHFERQQDWVGIMLAPSIRERIPDLASLCRRKVPKTADEWSDLDQRISCAKFAHSAPIPFHGGGEYEGFAVVPTDGIAGFEVPGDDTSASIKHLGRLKSFAPDPAAQAKYARSMKWLEGVGYSWRLIEARYKVWQEEQAANRALL
jgi:hypothetical protein